MKFVSVFLTALCLSAQDAAVLDPQGIRQAISTEKDRNLPPDANPGPTDLEKLTGKDKKAEQPVDQGDQHSESALKELDRQRKERELHAMRERDNHPPRFGADLFDVLEPMKDETEGGIPDDYILGVGDQLQIAGFGSAAFEIPAQVDGRGGILVPKVGTIKVSGLSLAKAKTIIQQKVDQQLAGTRVDILVSKLRQIRIFVLGDVYKPGSYLVPSLSSLVNVLGLAGGPTSLGSFREIRVVRAGQTIHKVDLYLLRSEGLGNMNISLQTGDTVFVPLAFNQVLLQGAFTRLAGQAMDNLKDQPEPAGRSAARNRISETAAGNEANFNGVLPTSAELATVLPSTGSESRRQAERLDKNSLGEGLAAQKELLPGAVFKKVSPTEYLPKMRFELLPGETARDAMRFAGGLLPNAAMESLNILRTDSKGLTNIVEVPLDKLEAVTIRKGDVISALPSSNRLGHIVEIAGWIRVPGTFERTEGLRVGDVLNEHSQILPDTYLERGEILRTLPNGEMRYLAFNVSKALAGKATDNLLLEDRDKIDLVQVDSMRLPKTVKLAGPFSQAGTYEFREGMRASDLVFKAGIPLKSANQMVAELARSRRGLPSEVRQLDISKLISTEKGSPTDLLDEVINPMLLEDDQISIWSKPDFKIHRVVSIEGQVERPGNYVLDSEHPTLSELIERAGGLTPNAMPKGGAVLRPLNAIESGTAHFGNPAAIPEILERLNETKLYALKAASLTAAGSNGTEPQPLPFKVPVLHGLEVGKINRVIVDFPSALAKKEGADLEMMDGDVVIVPRQTETALVVGETSSPYAFFKVTRNMTVSEILQLAGGLTRNADRSNIRLLKASGQIIDTKVAGRLVEAGDSVLVPQAIHRDTSWQENLLAMTPIAILINALKH